jgi:hypothetical protein
MDTEFNREYIVPPSYSSLSCVVLRRHGQVRKPALLIALHLKEIIWFRLASSSEDMGRLENLPYSCLHKLRAILVLPLKVLNNTT